MTLPATGRNLISVNISGRILAICGLLFVLSQILFSINIQFPRGYDFDEFHYVPAAKQFLQFSEPRNMEHPPLGKMIMAAGIAIGGDRPFGWRLMSTIFGSLTVVGLFLWALALFRDEGLALWVALLTMVDQLVYVQARIGMLDTFMMGFLAFALALFCWAWNPGLSRISLCRRLGGAGVLFALAASCKWFAIVPWLTCWALILALFVIRGWHVTFAGSNEDDWYHSTLFQRITAWEVCVFFGFIPAVVYFATFVPYTMMARSPYHLWDLFQLQSRMFGDQLRVVNTHPYMSQWTDWAIMKRPIWYAFDKEGWSNEDVRGVVLLGNPLIMWSGLLALLFCIWGWVQNRSREAFLILVFYCCFYFSWALIPRKVSFYYYYYPAGLTLGLALAYFFSQFEKFIRSGLPRWIFLICALGLFVYFFPILAALKIPSESFRKWMWLNSWI